MKKETPSVKQFAGERGIALMAVFVMASALLALFGAYVTLTKFEQQNTRFSKQSVSGFYAAEAGLNVRAETIRSKFEGYNVPSGTSPTSTNPCVGSNQGSGDYACQTFDFNNRDVMTYITEEPGNPYTRPIPRGEKYETLIANEYRYTTRAEAKNQIDKTEALLELRLRNRTVPLFQFAAFYNKDLEINNGANMTLDGPVHTNGSLFSSPNATLNIRGQVTVAGNYYRGRKSTNQCAGTVTVRNRSGGDNDFSSCNGGSRRGPLKQSDIDALDSAQATANRWNGLVQLGVTKIEVPPPGAFAPDATGEYWSVADLRLVLPLNSTNNPIPAYSNPTAGIEVATVGGSADTAKSNLLNSSTACPGVINGRVVGLTYIHDYREAYEAAYANSPVNSRSTLLDVDVRGLLACLHNNPGIMGKALNESSDGGLVLFFTVKGPRSSLGNSYYGVRLRNAANLRAASNAPSAPNPLGVTVVSDQMAYIFGNYNASSATFRTGPSDNTGYLPAAIMADAITILSPSWQDTYTSSTALSLSAWTSPTCVSTNLNNFRGTTNVTINAAFLANTNMTGGAEGTPGMDRDTGGNFESYNGGLENYPRFLEHWGRAKDCSASTQTVTYRGSFVSLGSPKHTSSSWRNTGNFYNAPTRAWSFDTNFRTASNLPPRSPRFVYLKQELFVRDFEQGS